MKLVSVKAGKGKEKYILTTIESNGNTYRFKYKKDVSTMTKVQLLEKVNEIKKTWLLLYEKKVLERDKQNNQDTHAKDLFDYALTCVRPTLSANTYRNYGLAVRTFLQLDGAKLEPFTQGDYSRFLESINASNNTKRQYTTYLKVLCNLLVKEQRLKVNPFQGKRQPQKQHNPVAPIPDVDRIKIMECLKERDRDIYLATMFIYYGFIRIKELIEIKIKDIDLERRTIRISGETSKTNRSRSVAIFEPLYKYLLEIRLNERSPDELLFDMKLKSLINRYCKAIKINNLPHYSLYRFKHSGVCNAYKNGLGIVEIKTQCGHTNIETTYKYLAGLGLINAQNLNMSF